MRSITIPPIKSPAIHPPRQPLVLPPSLDAACLFCVLPERGGKWQDHSAGRRHATNQGATPTANSNRGFCWEFDDTDDYFTVQDGDTLDVSGDISICVLCYPQSTGIGIIGKATGTGYSRDLAWGIGTSYKASLVFGNAAGQYFDNSATARGVANQWQVFGCTRDSSAVTYYLDGVGETPIAYAFTLTDKSYAMRLGMLSTGGHWPFDGYIAAIILHGRVLSAEEMRRMSDWLMA